MIKTSRFNRILLLWMLAAVGFLSLPASSFAACDMSAGQAMSSSHACCVHKTVCACDPVAAPSAADAQPSATPAGCRCVVPRPPISSVPAVDPIRHYIVAALPPRAGPVGRPTALTLDLPAPTLPDAFPRFVPPSPPRAPPV